MGEQQLPFACPEDSACAAAQAAASSPLQYRPCDHQACCRWAACSCSSSLGRLTAPVPDLAVPDLAAQIFLLDTKEQDRALADGQVWKEDAQWARTLDQGWDLARVRQARALHALRAPSVCHLQLLNRMPRVVWKAGTAQCGRHELPLPIFEARAVRCTGCREARRGARKRRMPLPALLEAARAEAGFVRGELQRKRSAGDLTHATRALQVAGEVMRAVGQDRTQWLDDGSEHPHRIALLVHEHSVPDVSARLADGLARAGVQARGRPCAACMRLLRSCVACRVCGAGHSCPRKGDHASLPSGRARKRPQERGQDQVFNLWRMHWMVVCTAPHRRPVHAGALQARIIQSGTGDWRYVDCVAARAGKLQALERVRALFGVPRERCAAAGDSGNDILMLEGAQQVFGAGVWSSASIRHGGSNLGDVCQWVARPEQHACRCCTNSVLSGRGCSRDLRNRMPAVHMVACLRDQERPRMRASSRVAAQTPQVSGNLR